MTNSAFRISLIKRRYWFIALSLAATTALILLWMGRPPICTCGTVKLWTGAVQSADNSQHLSDWYTPSHIIHGFLFYMLGCMFLSRNPAGDRLLAAVAIEAGWELLENSQYIIDRYREATMALGYNGDSVINSMADIGWMIVGFLFARRAPVWLTATLTISFELPRQSDAQRHHAGGAGGRHPHLARRSLDSRRRLRRRRSLRSPFRCRRIRGRAARHAGRCRCSAGRDSLRCRVSRGTLRPPGSCRRPRRSSVELPCSTIGVAAAAT
jgi:hypothetical protein